MIRERLLEREVFNCYNNLFWLQVIHNLFNFVQALVAQDTSPKIGSNEPSNSKYENN